MLERTARISFRISSVLSELEPDLHTGSATLMVTIQLPTVAPSCLASLFLREPVFLIWYMHKKMDHFGFFLTKNLNTVLTYSYNFLNNETFKELRQKNLKF